MKLIDCKINSSKSMIIITTWIFPQSLQHFCFFISSLSSVARKLHHELSIIVTCRHPHLRRSVVSSISRSSTVSGWSSPCVKCAYPPRYVFSLSFLLFSFSTSYNCFISSGYGWNQYFLKIFSFYNRLFMISWTIKIKLSSTPYKKSKKTE